MNTFLIFASIISMALARPDGLLHGDDGHVSVTQSSAGTYRYTVHLKDSLRIEERLADGTVFGQYTSSDANGVPHNIKYTSGPDGFRIMEGDSPAAPINNKIVDGTNNVVKNSDLTVPSAKSSGSEVFLPGGNPAPAEVAVLLPVEDTPEVKAAKEEFFTLYKAAAHIA